MNILIIALQRDSANGICVSAVVKELLSRKHRIVWISDYIEDDSQKIPGVVYRDVKGRFINRILTRKKTSSLRFDSLVKRIAKFLNRGFLCLKYFSWPLVSVSYARRVTSAALNVVRNNDIDIVIGVYTQIDALIAANRVKKEFNNIKYIAYFLDALSGGYGPRFFTEKQIRNRGKKWERRLLVNADLVVAMESVKSFFEQQLSNELFYNKTVFLDLPLITENHDIEDSSFAIPNGSGQVTRISYAGTLPKGVRSPNFFLKVFDAINDPNMELLFIGDTTDELQKAAIKDSRIKICGTFQHDITLRILTASDYLLSLGNSNSNMTPSKIFEYMSLRKPVIATYNTADDSSCAYLKKYPQSLLLNENDDIEVAVSKLKAFLSCEKEAITQEELFALFPNNLPSAFCKLAENVGDNIDEY